MNIQAEKAATAASPTMSVQFPFRIKQVAPDRVEIELTGMSITYISRDSVNRAFPWLSDDQLDALIEKLYHVAIEQSIRDGVKIK